MTPSTRVTRLPPLPKRDPAGHKGSFGRVLVIGGSANAIGAPAFAGEAALRTGAGYLVEAIPREVLLSVLTILPQAVGLGLGAGVEDQLRSEMQRADAIILGPGLGQSDDAAERVEAAAAGQTPLVVDADALNLIAKRWPRVFNAKAILTPHPGEMKRLAALLPAEMADIPEDHDARLNYALAASRQFRKVIVLKSHRTVVADGETGRVYLNDTGDSSLAKAGSGDVLSGILGALLANGMELFEAACLGVFVHGLAGELAGRRVGQRSVVAREIIEAIPVILRQLEAMKTVKRPPDPNTDRWMGSD